MMAADLFRRIGPVTAGSRFAVNIGCGDGISMNDPCYPLFIGGFSGIAIDAEPQPDLYRTLGHLPVGLLPATPVTPDNITEILETAGCPRAFDFLKIDIDGFDAHVLSSILASGYRPTAIQVEINPEIPPPYLFSVAYNPAYIPGGEHGFYGMSLAYAARMLSLFGYSLIGLDFDTDYTHDAMFIRSDVSGWSIGLPTLEPRTVFLDRRALLIHLHSATEQQRLGWRYRTDHTAVLAEIEAALRAAAGRKRCPADFTLFLDT